MKGNIIQKKRIKQLNTNLHVTSEKVLRGAIAIEVPLLDWKGHPITVYVTENGKVTDGGSTINELTALRVVDQFNNWAFKADYYQRYGILEGVGNELVPADYEHLLLYVQGFSRIGYFFSPHPIGSNKKEINTGNKTYDSLTDGEVGSFLEIIKNRWKKGVSEEDKLIIEQAINRLRDSSGEGK